MTTIDIDVTSAKSCTDKHGSFASFNKNEGKCIVVLNKGYNSHGKWSTIERIREEELDRNNQHVVSAIDSSSLPKSTKAIWVDSSKRGALRYLIDAKEWDKLLYADDPLSSEEKELLNEIYTISLKKSDILVLNGGKYVGYLIARRFV